MAAQYQTPPRTAPQDFPAAFYDGVIPKRLIAWFIDVGFTAILSLPLVLPLSAIGLVLWFPFLLIPLVWTVVGFLYRWFTIANHSATWGMRLMAIELRDIDQQRLTSGMAFMHTLGSTLSFGFPLVQALSMLAMVLSEKGQGLTDMVLGTTMINKPA